MTGERASALAEALETRGWSVWWDRTIPTGKKFDEVIDEALKSARSIVVLWSRTSIERDWVLEEAEEGRERQVLIPVFIEHVKPPRGFRRYQAADLSDWDGNSTVPAFDKLIDDIGAILGSPPVPAEIPERAAAPERGRGPAMNRDTENKARGGMQQVGEPTKSSKQHDSGRQHAQSESLRSAQQQRARGSSYVAICFLPALFLLTYRFSLGTFSLYVTPAFVPLAVFLGYRYGNAGLITVALGGLLLPSFGERLGRTSCGRA